MSLSLSLQSKERWVEPVPERRLEWLRAALERRGLGADDVLTALAERASGRPSLLTGSLTEGWSNATSDIDLVILDAHQREGSDVFALGGVRVDCEVWDPTRLARITNIVALAADLDRRVEALRHDDREFCHLLLSGLPLIDADGVSRYRALLPRSAFILQNARRRTDYADASVQDAVGAIISGQALYAQLRSRNAMDDAVDAFLAVLGDTSYNPKHRILKLAERTEHAQGLMEQLLVRQAGWAYDEAGRLEVARANIEFAREVLIVCRRRIESLPGAKRTSNVTEAPR